MPVPLSRFIRSHTHGPSPYCFLCVLSSFSSTAFLACCQNATWCCVFALSLFHVDLLCFFCFDLWSSLFSLSLLCHCNVACHLALQKAKNETHLYFVQHRATATVCWQNPYFTYPMLPVAQTILNCSTDSIVMHNRSSLLMIHTPPAVWQEKL